MAKRCRYCFSALKEGSAVCGVCKIDSAKDRNTLTREEKTVSYFCRTLHLMAFLAALGGILGLVGSLAAIFRPIPGVPKPIYFIFVAINLVLAILFIVFGISLARYKKWCHTGGIVLYSLAIGMNLMQMNLIGVLFGALFLYYISSPTTRKILNGEL
jgi:hypothetical protein